MKTLIILAIVLNTQTGDISATEQTITQMEAPECHSVATALNGNEMQVEFSNALPATVVHTAACI